MVGGQAVALPRLTLNLPGDYEVQVAAHLTLQQLQTFGQEVDRCLKSLDQSGWQMINCYFIFWDIYFCIYGSVFI